jgi:hypothetical protein
MFEIGQDVVCVRNEIEGGYGDEIILDKSRIYMIRDIVEQDGEPCLLLHEARNRARPYRNRLPPFAIITEEPGYAATRFRPVRKTNISSLIEAVNKAPTSPVIA